MTRTVLFSPETFNLAEVTRAIEVARRMPGDVHCVFSGYSRRYDSHIMEAGFTYHRCRPELSERDAEALLALDQGRGRRNPLTRSVMEHRVASERALIREIDARAVVIGTTLSQIISARAERIPLVYVKPFAYCLPHIRSMRRTGMSARRTRATRVIDTAVAGLARTLVPRVRLTPPGWASVARAHGVELPGPTLGLLEADLNLITTPSAFIPPETTLPSNYQVVGPIFARVDAELPPLVAQLAQDSRPLVFVAVGSSGGRELVLPLLHALGGSPVNVLSPVNHLLTRADRSTLPGNVHVTGWLPAHRLGKAVDLAITHGGEGTIQNSLAQGWPMIGIPLQLEQRFNVMRCVDNGVARLVERRRVPHTDWAALITEVLNDPEMRARATGFATTLTDGTGPALAATLINRLV